MIRPKELRAGIKQINQEYRLHGYFSPTALVYYSFIVHLLFIFNGVFRVSTADPLLPNEIIKQFKFEHLPNNRGYYRTVDASTPLPTHNKSFTGSKKLLAIL